MKLYFILTAVLVLFTLTVPHAINRICNNLSSTEATASTNVPSITYASEAIEENETVKVLKTSANTVSEVDMFDYIVGTVAGEMPASFCEEALKAQAVASYTYAKYVNENGSLLSDSALVHQSFIDKTEQKERWGEKYSEYRSKIENAVNDVLGEYLTFEEKTAMTVFHALSEDKTNSAEEIWGKAIPYLISVKAPSNESSKKEIKFTENEFRKLFEEKGDVTFDDDSKKQPRITEKSDSGYIRKLSVGNKTFDSVEICEILSLPSANFTAKYSGGSFVFTAHGKGHGVGMTQYGAEYMAQNGKTYTEILSHFYTGTVLVKE